MPDERTAKERSDGGMETSINWDDAPGALSLLREEYEKVARIDSACLTYACRTHQLVCVERAPIAEDKAKKTRENIYHGNIVFHASHSKRRRRSVAHLISLHATVT